MIAMIFLVLVVVTALGFYWLRQATLPGKETTLPKWIVRHHNAYDALFYIVPPVFVLAFILEVFA